VEAGFDFQPRTRIVFGAGCLATLGERVRELGARRVLLVTDPGLVAAGHAERGAAAQSGTLILHQQ
jgi:alcohol dehydrogenase